VNLVPGETTVIASRHQPITFQMANDWVNAVATLLVGGWWLVVGGWWLVV
jgi:hypothetical protein